MAGVGALVSRLFPHKSKQCEQLSEGIIFQAEANPLKCSWRGGPSAHTHFWTISFFHPWIPIDRSATTEEWIYGEERYSGYYDRTRLKVGMTWKCHGPIKGLWIMNDENV